MMRLNLLDHRPSFVASSSLTSCPPMAIERDSRNRTFFFCASRGGSARLALVRQTRGHLGPCRSIESYLSMGNNMVARKAGEEEGLVCRGPRAEERKRERGAMGEREKASHRTCASAALPKLCRLFRTVGL